MRGGGLHRLGVGLAVRAGVVGEQRGEPFRDGLRRHHPHLLFGELLHPVRDRTDVAVVGQHDHLVAVHRVDRFHQLGDRRVHRLPACDDPLHPEGAEDASDPVTARHRDHRGDRRRTEGDVGGTAVGGLRGLSDPAFLLDLLEKVGDPDVPRPSHVERGFDGRADLVGVDVAVPEAVAPDHDDRVTETSPDLLEHRNRLVGRFEEVHHLVAELGEEVLRSCSGCSRRAPIVG